MTKPICLSTLIILMALSVPSETFAQKRPKEVNPTETETVIANGRLSIYACPIGASIYLNNNLKGKYQPESKLGKSFDLKPGRYQVKIEHSDYQSFTRDIVIEPGKLSTIVVDMTRQFGYLELELPQLSSATVIKIGEAVISPQQYFQPAENLLRIKMQVRKYLLTIEEPGYKTYSNEIEITGRENLKLLINLERLAARVRLTTQSGARVYIDNQPQGTVSENGVLELALALSGRVPILIEHDSYQSYRSEIDLSPGAEIELPIALQPKVTSTEFSDNFEGNLNLWRASTEWQTENGLLRVRGAKTMGMPKERYYCDSEVVFGIKLKDTRGAAWIARAIDDRNYYLFYLNGPDGPSPNRFQVFICRDGVIDLNSPLQPPLPIPTRLKVNQDYRITIKIEGNRIQHEISDGSTGEEFSLGFFADDKKSFTCGNFGFATISNEDFYIHGFSIRPIR